MPVVINQTLPKKKRTGRPRSQISLLAQEQGISYKQMLRRYKRGQLDVVAFQAVPRGTIKIRDSMPERQDRIMHNTMIPLVLARGLEAFCREAGKADWAVQLRASIKAAEPVSDAEVAARKAEVLREKQ